MTDAAQSETVTDPGDETTVVVTTNSSAAPVQVWDVLVAQTSSWWDETYLGPDGGGMGLEPRLGGRVYSGASPEDGAVHGTIRAFDPPERLEIGGVLVPGAYTGTIAVTIGRIDLGSEIRIEHMARGRIEAGTEDRIAEGWNQMATALADLAEA